jgi:hypothetical protein
MIGGMGLILLVGLTAGPAWQNDQDAFTITLKDAAQGDTIRVEKKSSERSTVKITDSQGNSLKNKEDSKTQTMVYRETLLQKRPGERKASKLRRHYEKASAKTGDDSRALPYEEKNVLIEKKRDHYVFQIEGGEELTGQDAEELDREFNKQGEGASPDINKIMLPRKPVRVGESWTFPTEVLVRDLEKSAPMEFDAAGAKGSARLTRVYDRDGRRFGVIEYRFALPLKAFKTGADRAPIEEGASMVLTASVDGCIDGSLNSSTAKLRMTMKGRAELSQGGAKFTLHFDTRADGVQTERELARK